MKPLAAGFPPLARQRHLASPRLPFYRYFRAFPFLPRINTPRCHFPITIPTGIHSDCQTVKEPRQGRRRRPERWDNDPYGRAARQSGYRANPQSPIGQSKPSGRRYGTIGTSQTSSAEMVSRSASRWSLVRASRLESTRVVLRDAFRLRVAVLCVHPFSVPSRPVPFPSRLVPSGPVPVPSRPVPSRPVPSRPVPSRLLPSGPVPSRPAARPVPSRSRPVPFRSVPSHPYPSRPVPSRPVLSSPVPLHLLMVAGTG